MARIFKKDVRKKQSINPRPTARQAFNVPKSAAVKAISKLNAEQSPLLRLPPEVRSRIWEELLGNLVLQVEHSGRDERSGWTVFHYLDAEIERKVRSLSLSRGEIGIPNRPDKHGVMSRIVVDVHANRVTLTNYDTPQLQVLRSCRQAYLEVNPIFWSTNVFVFWKPNDFIQFLANRNAIQRHLIGKVRMVMMNYDAVSAWYGWQTVLTYARIKDLRNVRNLEILIDLQLHEVLNSIGPWTSNFAQSRVLRILPLESVKVSFMPGLSRNKDIPMALTQWAADFEAELLNPNGLEEYDTIRKQNKEAIKEQTARKKAFKSQQKCSSRASEAGCIQAKQIRSQAAATKRGTKSRKTIKHCGRKHECECPGYPCEHSRAYRLPYSQASVQPAKS